MNFFKDKVRKYQEKKLLEAEQKIKFHTGIKGNLEKELKKYTDSAEIKREIQKQEEFIQIWQKNLNSIKTQLKKLGT